jgi:hypothetical protein
MSDDEARKRQRRRAGTAGGAYISNRIDQLLIEDLAPNRAAEIAALEPRRVLGDDARVIPLAQIKGAIELGAVARRKGLSWAINQ